MLFHRPAERSTLAKDGATVKNRPSLPWEFATDVYRYVSSTPVEDHVRDAAISSMIQNGVAPGYCNAKRNCEFGGSVKPIQELSKADCKAERLTNKGRMLIFVYPDTTLRGGRVWVFEPHSKGELCSGRTASYYGILSNPLTGSQTVGTTVRVLSREEDSTVYVVGDGTNGGTDNAPLLPVLGWLGSSARIWEFGDLDRGRGVIVDTQISWSDEELAGPSGSTEAEIECKDDKPLRFSAPDTIRLSCPHSFSLRSMDVESDAVFGVTQVGRTQVQPVHWHAADGTEVRFAKGTYVIETRMPRPRAGEARLGVDVQEIALDEGKFGGNYAELPREIALMGTIEHGTGLYAGLAVSNATPLTVSLSELEMDVDIRLTDSQGQEIDSSTNPSNADDRVEVLLWPGLYVLAIEAIDAGSSGFKLELNSRIPAPRTEAFNRNGWVAGGRKSFEILIVPDLETVTIGLTELSADVDIRLFSAEGTEVGSSTNLDNADEGIVAGLWPDQYALEIIGVEDSSYHLDVERRTPKLHNLPFKDEGWIDAGKREFVRFAIHETTTVRASLSGLTADVDLYIVGKSGELASSINGGNTDEWLEKELPPGEYFMSVHAFDAGSNYLLAASDDPEWTGPEVDDDGANPEE